MADHYYVRFSTWRVMVLPIPGTWSNCVDVGLKMPWEINKTIVLWLVSPCCSKSSGDLFTRKFFCHNANLRGISFCCHWNANELIVISFAHDMTVMLSVWSIYDLYAVSFVWRWESMYLLVFQGVALLSHLYQECLDACGLPHYPMLLSLLQASCQPYLRWVSLWWP